MAEPNAAVLLERESALNLEGEPDPGLRAEITGDLALAESRAGMYAQSATHFDEAASGDRATGIPEKYFYDVEEDRAQAEIESGANAAAIERLTLALRSDAGRRDPGDMVRGQILNTLGVALLHDSRDTEALKQFESALAINRKILDSPGAQLERDSVRQLYEASFCGAVVRHPDRGPSGLVGA